MRSNNLVNLKNKIMENMNIHKGLYVTGALCIGILAYTGNQMHQAVLQHQAVEHEIQMQKEQLDEINQQMTDMQTQVQELTQELEAEKAEAERRELEEQKAREEQQRRKEMEERQVATVSRGSSEHSGRVMQIECTYYTAAADEGSGTGITASGTYATAGRTVACNFFFLCTRVRIDGEIFIVEDRGGMGGNVVDIFVNSKSEAFAKGRHSATMEVL